MALNPETQYPGKIAPSTPDYPYGAARNITTPGDGTGTPWEAALVNDLFGFLQALLSQTGTVPSGNPDTAIQSQYTGSLIKLAAKYTDYVFDTLADAQAGTLPDGSAVDLTLAERIVTNGETAVNDGGRFYVKDGTTSTPSTGNADKFYDVNGDGWASVSAGFYSSEGQLGPTLTGNLRYSAILSGKNNLIDMGGGAVGLGDGVLICGGNANQILAAFDGDCQGAFIGGGWENIADGYWVTIAGGKANEINADIVNYSFIGGGNRNLINGTQAFLSVICGGRDNVISGATANRCFIGGGGQNVITGAATSRAVLVGGEDNLIDGDNAFYTFLGGGQNNNISGQNSGHAVLVGGDQNDIQGSTTTYAVLVGGQSNIIGASSAAHSIIVGGRENNIQNNAQYSVIVGGFQNLMNGQRSFIGSGFANNIATTSGTQNAIVGGNANKMLSTTVQNSFIGGGFGNEIGTVASGTVLTGVSILGGEDNIAIGSRASILGGLGLRADRFMEVVKGTYNDPANPDGIGTPSKTTYVAGQIAEALGIGTSDVARANAYVWLKNGKQIRYNTPVYADNAAALGGGELVGTVYRTATGALMEVY